MLNTYPNVMVIMEKILERVKEDHVKFVQLQFTDLLGVVKSLTIPVAQLEGSLTDGNWFDGSSIEGFDLNSRKGHVFEAGY